MTWLNEFCNPGRADVIVGGQFGSEGKGAAAAYLARRLAEAGHFYSIYTTNAGCQSGHTSIHMGLRRVAYHLPTAALIAKDYGQQPFIYLNGGAIIDPDVLRQELEENNLGPGYVYIHPDAAVVTQDCRDAENRHNSAQTKIASTRKGVGEALARKVLRSGLTAKYHPFLARYVSICNIGALLRASASVLVEVPQGIGLSIDGGFYPNCTSRNCTVQQGLADAGIHPYYYGSSVLVLRTAPIRVGNIVENGTELGQSGSCYTDQTETTWQKLGVEPELTTVTKRVRRVFSFSIEQARHAIDLTRPELIVLTFCDYPVDVRHIVAYLKTLTRKFNLHTHILYSRGPTTDDIADDIADDADQDKL